MELSLRKMEEMLLYSNKTIEKVMTSLVNESSNAVLCATYEDCVLLLDHKEGQFYLADYTFDNTTAQFVIENFDPINLTKNNVNFKAVARKFFESDDVGVLELAEEYKENTVSQDNFISDLITESMIGKNFSEVLDYSEVASMNEDVAISGEKFFTSYKKRLSTHPVNAIKFFNWKDPIKVSLLETEKVKKVSKNATEKTNDLWKKAEFKEIFEKASLVFIEDVENGTEEFKKLFEEYPQILKLSAADRNTLFGKTAISMPSIRESRTDLVKGLGILFEQFDLKDMLNEAEEEEEDETEADTTPAPELNAEELKKIADELKKIAGKVTDEKVKEKLESIISKLGGEEGTPVDVVKEAVELLSI